MRVQRFFMAWVGALLITAGVSADQQVRDVRFGVEADGRTRVVIETSEAADFRAFTLEGTSDRLVVDLPVSQWAVRGLESGEGLGAGMVDDFRFFNNTTATSRVVFALDTPAVIVSQFALDPVSVGGNYRYVIDLERAGADTRPFSPASAPMRAGGLESLIAERVEAVYTPPARDRRVIVIDAGHGGHDPGASGRNGTRERDVTLEAARELRRQLESTGRYDVVLTRDSDVFLTLQQRVQVAADVRADLFLSIHADSVPSNPSARGAAVYTLNDRAETRARDRALQGADRSRQPDVNNILVSLELREKRNQSSAFAEVLLQHLSGSGALLTNPHRQENFYVLLDSRVPAVLLEMGFLSNSTDEANLNSVTARRRQMTAVQQGIDSYFAGRGDDNDTDERRVAGIPAR